MPEPGSSSGWNAPLTDRFDLSNPGLVVLKTGKVELGQGILLALRQIAAEELDLNMDAVVTVSGDTRASPFEGGTVGSMSIETSGHDVRDAAAVLKSELFDVAARKLDVSPSENHGRRRPILRSRQPIEGDVLELGGGNRFPAAAREFCCAKIPEALQDGRSEHSTETLAGASRWQCLHSRPFV